ncbi:MAG: HIT family protein [Methylacidiphilales bacterium]|nr:HIT family protein [Candidatus Methylacidiphilales bacterium]MDW8349032.1 HIT family protein [Verrucomicrobiae bacterium]
MSSIFTRIIQREIPAAIVYEDDLVIAFLDIAPIHPGHTLVVPKQEVASLTDLPPDTGAHLFRIAQKIANAIRSSSLPCDGINLWLNDGAAAGQEIFHLHLHVIPRIAGDGFGWHRPPHLRTSPTPQELASHAAAIRQALV